MGLDIRVMQRRKVECPFCGEIIDEKDIDCVESGGRAWYDVLESIGYYVPFEKRTEDNDWYGHDMVLSKEQALKMRTFALTSTAYNAKEIAALIAGTMIDGDNVVINADW